MTPDSTRPTGVPASGPAIRLGVAFVLGCLAALSGIVFGMPGKGEFVVVIWTAVFVALLIAPGWPGFIALIAGATVSAAVSISRTGCSGSSS